MSATFRPKVPIVPAVGVSSPATSDSSVLLPQPDAPMRQTNSPSVTSSDTRSRACTVVLPWPKALDTSLIGIAVVPCRRAEAVGLVPERADAPGTVSRGRSLTLI